MKEKVSSDNERKLIMITIFLGAPGTGKGTASEELVRNYGWKHISTGEAFRNIIESGSKLGLRVKGIIEGGDLVDDETTAEVLESYLDRFDMDKDKIILDGYPRTMNQVDHISKLQRDGRISMDKVIFFKLDSETQLARLTGRIGCPECKAGYHKVFKKPQVEGVCDNDGATLTQRKDDKIENVKVRLEVYEKLTAPVVEFYKNKNILVSVDASVSPEHTAKNIDKEF